MGIWAWDWERLQGASTMILLDRLLLCSDWWSSTQLCLAVVSPETVVSDSNGGSDQHGEEKEGKEKEREEKEGHQNM
jgi:hypothetical protein